MAPASVQIFGSPTTAEVARVLTCCFEKEVEFRLIRVDNFKGSERKPDYMKPNYLKLQAVTFEDGKKTLVDSREICRYISEIYAEKGEKGLIGAGTLERASIEQWLQMEEEIFDPPASDLVLHLAFGVPTSEAELEENKQKLTHVLDIYDDRLSATPYLAGNNFTLADLSHLPNAHRLISTERCADMFRSRKNVSNWLNMISRRRSWRKVMEMQQQPSPES